MGEDFLQEDLLGKLGILPTVITLYALPKFLKKLTPLLIRVSDALLLLLFTTLHSLPQHTHTHTHTHTPFCMHGFFFLPCFPCRKGDCRLHHLLCVPPAQVLTQCGGRAVATVQWPLKDWVPCAQDDVLRLFVYNQASIPPHLRPLS